MENCIHLPEYAGLEKRVGMRMMVSLVGLIATLIVSEVIPDLGSGMVNLTAYDCRRVSTELVAETLADGVMKTVESVSVLRRMETENATTAEADLTVGLSKEEVSVNCPEMDMVIGYPEAGRDRWSPDIPMSGNEAEEAGNISDGEMPGSGAVVEEDERPDTGSGTGTVHSVAGFLIDGAGMICGIDPAAVCISDGYLELPSAGCRGIRRGALVETGRRIEEIYIPASITAIEAGAFSDLHLLGWIEVQAGNPVYISVDGVLMNPSMTTILAFPAGRTDTYIVPESVTAFADNAFANTSISCLDMWKCGSVKVGTAVFGARGGGGIRIKAPEGYAELYSGLFAGCNVEIL